MKIHTLAILLAMTSVAAHAETGTKVRSVAPASADDLDAFEKLVQTGIESNSGTGTAPAVASPDLSPAAGERLRAARALKQGDHSNDPALGSGSAVRASTTGSSSPSSSAGSGNDTRSNRQHR
jgi:hypothetical protein